MVKRSGMGCERFPIIKPTNKDQNILFVIFHNTIISFVLQPCAFIAVTHLKNYSVGDVKSNSF